jgi:feruloyl esterase
MGTDKVDEFLRLYLVPGMYHCSGGPGPDVFDDLTALEKWVEEGSAPGEIIAYKTRGDNDFYPDRGPGDQDDDNIVRSRPLCPYPGVAKYSGSGSIDNAENFSCITPLSSL